MSNLAELIEMHFENADVDAWNRTHRITWWGRHVLRLKRPKQKPLPEAHIHWAEVSERWTYPPDGPKFVYEDPCRDCAARNA